MEVIWQNVRALLLGSLWILNDEGMKRLCYEWITYGGIELLRQIKSKGLFCKMSLVPSPHSVRRPILSDVHVFLYVFVIENLPKLGRHYWFLLSSNNWNHFCLPCTSVWLNGRLRKSDDSGRRRFTLQKLFSNLFGMHPSCKEPLLKRHKRKTIDQCERQSIKQGRYVSESQIDELSREGKIFHRIMLKVKHNGTFLMDLEMWPIATTTRWRNHAIWQQARKLAALMSP